MKRFRIINEFGADNVRKFGRTYLAVDNDTQQKIILKEFIQNSKNEHLRSQIQQESTFHFKLEGLPQVIDYSSKSGSSLLVLKHKEGIPIDQYWKKLKRSNRLLFLKELLRQLTPIFHQLASEGIVHCDIKPGNIIIEEKKMNFSVHLIDFGMAIKKSTVREIIFPLGYAAPELILNHLSIIDQRTDQYSLGILIWKLYTEELPLFHNNPSILTNLQITHPLPNHSRLPNKIFRILYKMTKKHQFSLPPNRMNDEEVILFLKKGINERYANLSRVLEDFEKIKPPFYHIRSLR